MIKPRSVCARTSAVPLGLAHLFHSTRHCRAGLSHAAAARLCFRGICSTHPMKASFHAARRRERQSLSRTLPCNCISPPTRKPRSCPRFFPNSYRRLEAIATPDHPGQAPFHMSRSLLPNALDSTTGKPPGPHLPRALEAQTCGRSSGGIRRDHKFPPPDPAQDKVPHWRNFQTAAGLSSSCRADHSPDLQEIHLTSAQPLRERAFSQHPHAQGRAARDQSARAATVPRRAD